jgi:hypothetical protein
MRRMTLLLTALAVGAATVAATTTASASSPIQPPTPVSQDAPKPTAVRLASTPSFSQTICWGGVNNETVIPWFGAPVTSQQAVVATAVEQGAPGDEFFGGAHVFVEGVAVHQGLVQVRVRTEWGAPINVCVHFVG